MNLWQAWRLWRKLDPVLDQIQEANVSKSLWKSKTFWVNLLGGLFELFQVVSQTDLLPPGTVAVILAAINVALRTITTQPVHLKAPKAAPLLLVLLLPTVASAQELPVPEVPVPATIEIPNLPGVTVDSIVEQAMKLAVECAQDEACIRAGAQPNPIVTTFDRTCRAATDWAQLADTATTMFAMGWQASKDHHGINDGVTVIEANPAVASIVGNSLLFAGAKWLAMQGIKRATDALRNSDRRGMANLAECGAAAALTYVAVQNHRIMAGLGGS